MDANGLSLVSIDTTSESIRHIKPGELEAQLESSFQEPGFVVVYLDYKVLAGRWTGNHFQFHAGQTIEEKFIQKIRVFNTNKEFLAWRVNNGMRGRIRTDDFQGKGTDVVIAQQVLFGTRAADKGNNFNEIFEKRGTSLLVPFENLIIDEMKNRLFIKTHNYIGYNQICQATYTDCRFVAFTDGRKVLD